MTMGRNLRIVDDHAAESTSTAELIDRWAVWQTARGLSNRTVEERARLVSMVARDLGVPPDQWRAISLTRWLAKYRDSPGTRSTYHSMLRAWHTWLVATGQRPDDPMAELGPVRSPRRTPRPAANEHIKAMLVRPMWPSTRAMIILAAWQGMRVHEIAHHRGEYIDLHTSTLRILGKGGSDKTIPLSPVAEALVPHFPRRGWWFPAPGPNHLYPHGGGHVLPNSISQRIGAVMRRADVPGTPHTLRHWYGTELLHAGVDIRVIQQLMRHDSLTSTQIYTQVAGEAEATAIRKLPRLI